ncbi:MAG: metal ABC transporter ATP-binding protein [Planctomycetota bacterium]
MSTPALEVRDVSLSFRGMAVLEAVNFTLEEGGFLGIIGPNGAGKSVLFKVILGLLRPDRGSVRVFGEPPERASGLIGYVPQHARFDDNFPISVLQVVLMSQLGRDRLLRRYRREDRDRALAALERVEMAHLAERQIGKLSGGQLQRVLIARALAVDARLMLLDEPTANLDSRIGGEIYALLASLTPTCTVVLVSHDISVMSRHVKTVACMNRRLHYHGTREVTREMLEATYECPVDFVVHEHTHRVLTPHEQSGALDDEETE